MQVKQHELGHHQFLSAHMFGRIDSIDADIADIDERVEARLAPFLWKTILDTGSSSPKTWGCRLCYHSPNAVADLRKRR